MKVSVKCNRKIKEKKQQTERTVKKEKKKYRATAEREENNM